MFQATLFDFNGVLVDDEAVHLAAFQDALAPQGVSLSEHDYWQRYLGFDDAGAFRAILTDAGSPPDDALVAELIERKRPLYLARAQVSLVTFPGAREGLELCASFGPVCIVSGTAAMRACRQLAAIRRVAFSCRSATASWRARAMATKRSRRPSAVCTSAMSLWK